MKKINDGKNATSTMTASTDDVSVYTNKMDNLIEKTDMRNMPLDTISRYDAKKTLLTTHEVEYYCYESASLTTTILNAVSPQTSGTSISIIVANAQIFSESDIIGVIGINGYNEDGITLSDKDLKLLFIGVDLNGNPIVRAINGHGKAKAYLPSIPEGATLIRMGKACCETDKIAPKYAVTSTLNTNYCQNLMINISSKGD